jgi:hypothetical protein
MQSVSGMFVFIVALVLSGCSDERQIQRMLNGKGAGAEDGLAEDSWIDMRIDADGEILESRCEAYDLEDIDTAEIFDALPMPGMCSRGSMLIGCMAYDYADFYSSYSTGETSIYAAFLVIEDAEASPGEVTGTSGGSGVVFIQTAEDGYELYQGDGETSLSLTDASPSAHAAGSYSGKWDTPDGGVVSVSGSFELRCP